MKPLATIELTARALGFARARLSIEVADLQAELIAAQKRHLTGIKKSVALCAGLHNDLVSLIESNPSAFQKPRTRIFHGIQVGYRKQKGTIEIDDPAHTIKLIERLYADNPDLLALLIRTEKTPNKDGIKDLPVSDAKKIGCEILSAGDAVVVRPVDGEVEKTVKALLASAVEERHGDAETRRHGD